MALAVENSNKVWQKVKLALNAGAGANKSFSPATQEALLALKQYLATQMKNPDLQFIPFSAAQIVTNGGYSPDIDAHKVYAFVGKNSGAGDGTDSFVSVHDATSNAATTSARASATITDDYDEFALIFPRGLPMGTELTVSAATAIAGSGESAEANACDGFVIVGAA